MLRPRHLLFTTILLSLSVGAIAQVDVLYVASQSTGSQYSLVTYNVNPTTAAATQAGSPISISANGMVPVTVNGKNYLYVWDSTAVWVYSTDARGVPSGNAVQRMNYGFSHTVTRFLVDPNGKFAYACLSWYDAHYDNLAAIYLFTIDQSTGELTNTNQVVANYGPNQYIQLLDFQFGQTGKRLYAYYADDGPHTCIDGYYYYTLKTDGSLGPQTSLVYAQDDCSGAGAVAVSDALSGSSSACCGAGSGLVTVVSNANYKQQASCEFSPEFCADEAAGLYFDPANENAFFADRDTTTTYILHIDFSTSQLESTSYSIPNNWPLHFSPDSRLVYAVNSGDIEIYALQSSTGDLTANTSLTALGRVSVATATLKQ